MSDSNNTALPPAALWKRIFAIIYDSLIYMALAMAYSALVLFIQVQINGEPAAGERASMGTIGFIGLVLFLSSFCSFCWRQKGGQTLGMKAWRLILVNEEGKRPSWVQCYLRCLLAPLMLAAAGIGYLYALIDKDSRCLHDIISKTYMLQLPKSK
ncbi:RDD family protein [uncultured Pseudoteredinibacter sp.]|uniref:RDD family protein n=1 Tax=uncultured Pseudoteredinibacter sp. TaxID=1641701 RepID=UPI00260D4158|nr:RDD family protein [uncultured Pseudoteredinibacter sp.]